MKKLKEMSKRKRANRGKPAEWPELESDAYKWLIHHCQNSVAVSAKMIRIQAKRVMQDCNIESFKGGGSLRY